MMNKIRKAESSELMINPSSSSFSSGDISVRIKEIHVVSKIFSFVEQREIRAYSYSSKSNRQLICSTLGLILYALKNFESHAFYLSHLIKNDYNYWCTTVYNNAMPIYNDICKELFKGARIVSFNFLFNQANEAVLPGQKAIYQLFQNFIQFSPSFDISPFGLYVTKLNVYNTFPLENVSNLSHLSELHLIKCPKVKNVSAH